MKNFGIFASIVTACLAFLAVVGSVLPNTPAPPVKQTSIRVAPRHATPKPVTAAPSPTHATPKPVTAAPKPTHTMVLKIVKLHGHYTLHQARNNLKTVGRYPASRLDPVCYFGEYGESVQGYGPNMVLVTVRGAYSTNSRGDRFTKAGWIFYQQPWLLGDDVPVCETED